MKEIRLPKLASRRGWYLMRDQLDPLGVIFDEDYHNALKLIPKNSGGFDFASFPITAQTGAIIGGFDTAIVVDGVITAAYNKDVCDLKSFLHWTTSFTKDGDDCFLLKGKYYWIFNESTKERTISRFLRYDTKGFAYFEPPLFDRAKIQQCVR